MGANQTKGKAEVSCKICGAEVTAKDPAKYPYCEVCHYTGRAETDLRSAQVERFRKAIPDARFVGVEHTGGGCFWLAVRFEGEAKYYVATDGDASLPTTEDGAVPLAEGGWGYVGRHDDTEGDENDDYEGTPVLQPIIDGEDSWTSDRYWAEYPAHSLSDEQVVEAILRDRTLRLRRPLRVEGHALRMTGSSRGSRRTTFYGYCECGEGIPSSANLASVEKKHAAHVAKIAGQR